MNNKKGLLSLIFISIFILVFFSFLWTYYTYYVEEGLKIFKYPHEPKLPLFPLIGYLIIILCFFYIFIFNQDISLNVSIFNEYTTKLFLISLMMLSLFIAPIEFSNTIIIWDEIGLMNYIRGIIFIIGIPYVLGGSLFNLFLKNVEFHKLFDIESFFIKLIIYPILSFLTLGISVLILDFFGFKNALIDIILLMIIVLFFFLDIIINKKNFSKSLKNPIINIKISKATFLILILSIGVIIINIGMQFATQYLIEGDAWRSTQYAYFIGNPYYNTFQVEEHYGRYWGFISYGLSSLSGLPYLNINVFFLLFSYLWVFSIFLFAKTILNKNKPTIALISTVLIVSFSGLFFPLYEDFPVSSLITHTIIMFDYKGFSNVLLIFSMSIFIKISRNFNKENTQSSSKTKRNENILIIIIALLLIQSVMIYFLPIVPAILFMIAYCFISKEKVNNFKIFLKIYFVFYLFFILFDLLSYFFLSRFSMNRIFFMSNIGFVYQFRSNTFITYLILIFPLIFIKLIQLIYQKIKWKKLDNFIVDHKPTKKVFKIIKFLIIGIFLFLVVIEIFILVEIVSYEQLYIYYIHLIFEGIGFIGIISFVTGYLCYRFNKNLFYILIIWIILTILLASSLIFLNLIQNPQVTLTELSIPNPFGSTFKRIYYWYERMWQYSIIPISIIGAISLYKLKKYLERNFYTKKIEQIKIFKSYSPQIFYKKYLILSLIIVLSMSNLILKNTHGYNFYYKNPIIQDEVQMIGWISKNLPPGSDILLEYGKLGKLSFLSFYDTYQLNLINNEANGIGYGLINHLWRLKIGFYICKDDPYRLTKKIYNIKLYQYGQLSLYAFNPTYFSCTEGEGIYDSTFDFSCDDIGSKPLGWSISAIGNSSIEIIKEIDGQKKVVEYFINSSQYNKMKNTFSKKSYGSIEFWIRTSNSSKSFNILLRNDVNDVLGLILRNNKLYLQDTYYTISNISSNKWYHIRIDFRFNWILNYRGLDKNSFSIWINNTKMVSNFPLSSEFNELNRIVFMNSPNSTEFTIYIDAIDYSWDPKCLPVFLQKEVEDLTYFEEWDLIKTLI